MTARSKTIELLKEYGLIETVQDEDQAILVGVSTLINHLVMKNRHIIKVEDEMFRQQAILDSIGMNTKQASGWH